MSVFSGILCSLALLALFPIYFSFFPRKKGNSVSFVARVGVFGAMATILYVVPIFTIKLPFFPSFLTLHFDEVPCLIAGIAYGPVSGIAVILIKTLVKLPLTKTMGVGEISDFILSSVYVLVSALLYRKRKSVKHFAIALSIATFIQIIVSLIANVYLLIPFYVSYYFGGDSSALLSMIQKVIPAIKDIGWSYAVIGCLPFNLLKDGIVLALTIAIYRVIKIFLDKKRPLVS